ncbi:MAG: adenosylcobinamide-GDP ribazoletransferase [Hyphomicrobiales bacterium]|nr:adenosylcobinamide-GDP ribazoletransferase [Hyphomicrobiales bacterium]MBV8823778.1 adenosylcobinamide-GDP ribazoletransferase [Hyphomicrobiales bacterium]MBV9428454.1 adenosylcobinamide-GDP ribazoletransferase [Bradyrhizobiaceae bacterium]
MRGGEDWIGRITGDLIVAMGFYTRLPFQHNRVSSGEDLAAASWAAPVAGVVVGATGVLAYWLAHAAGLGPLMAAGLTIVATLLVTGGLHEDGLADTADAFGAGATPQTRLAIMRDSRIGTFGACALVLSFGLRWAAVASLVGPARVAAALIAAHAAARAMPPLLMRVVPPARPDGLSAAAGLPPAESVAAAALLGLAALLLGLGFGRWLIAVALLGVCLLGIRWLALNKIGGQTGDVLGALEQICEIVVLLVAARG